MLLTLLLLGCDPSPPAAPIARPSLVVVTLDTTRADRIGAYGYAGARTPTLDALAAQGARFERAYATVPLTTPSHSSMFSGLYPTRHGVRSNGDAVLPEQVTTLAELLQGGGWRTGAAVGAFVTTRIWNLDQGFDVFLDEVRSPDSAAARWARERRAEQVVDDAVAFLGQGSGPFFLWVHLFDAHAPYDPPAPWSTELQGRPYDGELAYIDSQLARLQAAVEAQQGPGGTAWIVMGDHGEALRREHGESDHGIFLFDPTMRVPFIVRPAEPLAQPIVVPGAVSGADLMPTALGLLGQPVPADLDGVDLSPALRGQALARGPVYMESLQVQQRYGFYPEVAVAEGELKLIGTPSARLYDLAADPAEEHNLLAERPEDAARLRAALERVQAQTVEAQRMAVSPELSQALEALGYVSGEGGGAPAAFEGKDAKDHLEVLHRIERARELGRHPSQMAEAEAEWRALVELYPELAEARLGLTRVLGAQGRHAEALAQLDAALAQQPDSAVLRSNRANVLAALDRADEALLELARVLEQVPTDDVARGMTLRLLRESGRSEEALGLALGWLEATPEDHGVQAQAGMLLLAQGDVANAERLLRESLVDGVPRPQVYRSLGLLAGARDQHSAALELFRAELEWFPGAFESRMSLANTLMVLQQWDEAAAEYSSLVSEVPEHLEARRGWAQAVFNTGDYALAAEILAPAVRLAPNDPEVLLLDANLMAKRGDPGAQARYEQAKAALAAQRARGPQR